MVNVLHRTRDGNTEAIRIFCTVSTPTDQSMRFHDVKEPRLNLLSERDGWLVRFIDNTYGFYIYGQLATHVGEVNFFKMSDHEIMVNKGRIVSSYLIK